MNKLFNFTQAKGKWHKFLSFNLGGGAKLYKNFAQKLLAVSLCMAMVLLGTPVTTFAEEVVGVLTISSDGKTVTGVTAPDGKEKKDITKVEIPAYVTAIRMGAFDGCSSLKSLIVDSTNPVYKSENNLLLSRDGTTLIACPGGLDAVTIPASVTAIGEGAFAHCSSLTSIDIPDSVASIGASAFFYCSSLTSIDIPDSVASIGESAFAYCYSLPTVAFPGSVASLGATTFYFCKSLSSVTIGDGVTSIGEGAFASCPSLTSIEIPDSVASIGNAAFLSSSLVTRVAIPCDF